MPIHTLVIVSSQKNEKLRYQTCSSYLLLVYELVERKYLYATSQFTLTVYLNGSPDNGQVAVQKENIFDSG